jgi:Protein of unknown function (DUF3455)
MIKQSHIEWAGRCFGPAVKYIKSTAFLLFAAATLMVQAADNRAVEFPADIAVPVGNKVHFQGFGVGFQIYTWDGTSWGKAVPEATLYDEDGNIVAHHFGGPTWQSNSGSSVVGKLPPKAVTVDEDAIDWLRLEALTTAGPGVFGGTTFIQRVNTTGGKAPSENGTVVGQVARIPYTADYIFYRQSTN